MSTLKSVLYLSDLHCPYHSERALDLVLKVGRWLRPYQLVVNGDVADFYSVSAHSKDPTRKDQLAWEVERVNDVFDDLDSLNAKKKLFVGGNHEDRLSRYLSDKAPALFESIRVQDLFRLNERGWKYVPYKSSGSIGHLNVTHDVGGAGRYTAFKALDMFHAPVVTGHSHRMSFCVEEGQASMNCGWLGDAKQAGAYMPAQSIARYWQVGFGVGYLAENGAIYLSPVPIHNDFTCVVNGKLFRN